MDEKKLWQKISGSITFYLKDYDRSKSNEELLEDYLDYVLPDDLEDDGVRRYLDKQTFKYVEVNKELEEKAINAFIERLNKRRSKEEPIEKVEEKRVILEISEYEQTHMNIIIGKEEYKRRDREYQKNKYLEKLNLEGKMTKKEELKILREKIKALREEGLKNKDISSQLNIPLKTLKRHITYMKKNDLLT